MVKETELYDLLGVCLPNHVNVKVFVVTSVINVLSGRL